MRCGISTLPAKGVLASSFLFLWCMWQLPVLVQSNEGSMYIPPSWRSMCTAEMPPQGTTFVRKGDGAAPSKPQGSHAPFGDKNPIPVSSSSSSLSSSSSSSSVEHRTPDGSKLVSVTCQVPNSDSLHWKFMELRRWHQVTDINRDTRPANRSVVYVISVQCDNGANVSLPWPMKTEGVREIHVANCGLLDRDVLYQDPLVADVDNELRKIELRDCISVVDVLSISDILQNSKEGNSINITRAFDCGQDSTLEVFIRSNFTLMSTQEFRIFRELFRQRVNSSDDESLSGEQVGLDRHVKPEDRIVTDSQSLISDHNGISGFDKTGLSDNLTSMNDLDTTSLSDLALMTESDIIAFMRKIMNTHSKCSYRHLRFQDESMTSDSFKYLLQFLAYGSDYPALKFMNYSMVGLREFPRGLHQWLLHFPKLRYVDLSHNSISQIRGEDLAFHSSGPKTVFNVRHNNITRINMEVLNSWLEAGSSHIDARDNPIHCSCDNTRSFIPFLQNSTTFTGRLKEYEYVKVLTCQSPPHLKGRELRTLSVSSLACPTPESQMGWIIALSVLLAIFFITAIILFRFKAEIRILLYTRLSIRLPWDADSQRHAKTYDAFVSYSNEDAKWVYQNIAALLESPHDALASTTTTTTTTTSPTTTSNTSTMQNGHCHSHSKSHDSSGGLNGFNNNNSSSNNNNNNNSNNNNNDNDDDNYRYSTAKIPAAKDRFKLCLHQRDFVAGMTIMDNIMDCIQASRHTIVVMSPCFMRSHWAMEELRQAYRQSLVERTRHLIVVMLDKISEADMDPLIKRCCKTFTYLDARDSIFKDRLIFSLTTKDRGAKRRDRYANLQREQERRREEIDSGAFDNDVYDMVENYSPPPQELPSGTAERPHPPARELSNSSATSCTELVKSFY